MATDADRRRIRALDIMERVKRLETEEKARAAGQIRGKMTQLEAEKETLIQRISGESHVEGVEGAIYLGRFIRSIRAEIERISSEMATLRPGLNKAEDALRSALAEQKTYEILRLSRMAELRHAEKKREAAEMDEVARQRWKG
ncbi:hypothetical protein ATO6_20240 [Oceanicola sp. 22II-s10i]|uniref:flagellar export protein FliJ n=1 Tax=Oceanicola sp. 22II-s10i TaxID=1317116 RepID=UPI000B520A0B|nr:flagellar export protein FliJ [Oceanicola sp. 22II-s10i]OWU83174.1 hypothetical protein ATO6_20240 [Oceanicola sp. 22II-s10i]